MSSQSSFGSAFDSGEMEQLVEEIWNQQLQTWRQGSIAPAETFFATHPELLSSPEHAVDVIFNEYAILNSSDGTSVTQLDLLKRFPAFATQLERQFAVLSAVDDTPLGSEASVDEPSIAQRPPIQVGPRYEIVGELGRGSMAVVYEAIDKKLKQRVAIKQPHPHVANSQRGNPRLLREARAVAKLHHPGIVPLREIDVSPDGMKLISPLIRGRDLMSLMNDHPPSYEQALTWAKQIADAAHYAHENGIVHRDIKPANVLISEQESALLMDFGLASDAENQLAITHTGEMIGTPAFMSPEQARSDGQAVDSRSDVYSIGATLYYLFTGQVPFSGSVSSVIQQLLNDTPKPLRSHAPLLPRDLDTIVSKCLEKNPQDRYASARDLFDDLRRLESGEPISARRGGLVERAVKFARRRPQWAAALAAIGLLLVFSTGSIVQLSFVTAERNRAQVAEQQNRRLLAQASLDAGRLAMQRGRLAEAVEHFRNGLEQSETSLPLTHLALTECYLAIGQPDEAADHLSQAQLIFDLETTGNPTRDDLALINYWEIECLAQQPNQVDEHLRRLEQVANRMNALPAAKQEFLLGLNAENSQIALDHFRHAVELDPYHHSARRMLLVLTLSLARFDETVSNAVLAQQLFPEDIDFALLEALGHSARGDLRKTDAILEALNLPTESRNRWGDFCRFFKRLSHDVHPRQGVYKTDVTTIAKLLAEFLEQHESLVAEQRWRFPPRIAREFLQLPEVLNKSGSADVNRVIAARLAAIHPEGSLLLIAAEAAIARDETVVQLERSRDLFRKAVAQPAFIQNSDQIAWLGVYTTSMSLNVLHHHQEEENQATFVEACRHLVPHRITDDGYLRTITITLINAGQWNVAEPFIRHRVELGASSQSQLDALWYLALLNKQQENWLRLLEICQDADSLIEQLISSGQAADGTQHGWQGLKQFATEQLEERIKD